ncbi:hypothetical protein G6F40_016638 [Rhizopus arrhizus]|nr:hypothetical protein G6F40_016638 [Rhizopus arrhizus]
MDHRQQVGQQVHARGRQWQHLAIAVEQRQCDVDAYRLHAALQFQPRHRVALDRGGEVEQCAGGRGQAEIQHGADLAVAPQQVGDVPVVVRP